MKSNKIKACFLLHALGDTIGYKNGDWEFNYGKKNISNMYTLEIVYEFIELGGITGIDLKGWRISDDTILHLAIARAFINDYNNLEGLLLNTKKEFIKEHDEMKKKPTLRFPGLTTMASIKKLKDGAEILSLPYNTSAGGSGASMRAHCIGFVFPNDVGSLLKYSIETSRLTHNSAIGYLGGFVSALFTSYAFTNIPIIEWPYKLIEILEGDSINNYIRKTRDFHDYEKDRDTFIGKWKRYINDKFDGNKRPIYRKSSRNLALRSAYYYESFTYRGTGQEIGTGGDSSVIVAYDCLFDSGDNWEKLVFYSMLHLGDSDTTGCIAGGWYGALYGLDKVPEHLLEHLELKEELVKTANDIYTKFCS